MVVAQYVARTDSIPNIYLQKELNIIVREMRKYLET